MRKRAWCSFASIHWLDLSCFDDDERKILEYKVFGKKKMAAASVEEGINLNAFEAEQIISNLNKFSLDQVGSLKWFNQHESLETLNIQVLERSHR